MAFSWRQRCYEIIFETDTAAGKSFDIILIFLILVSTITVSLESVTRLQQEHQTLFFIIEWTITLSFTIEYILRLVSSPKPFQYASSFFGIIDMLAIFPSYFSLLIRGGKYLQVVRALRLLRIFRILKLAEYLHEAQVLILSLKASFKKITIFLFTVVILVTIIGALIYVIEGPAHGFMDIPTSIYWAIVTLTTVGYGDIAPGTAAGKFLASLVMLIGYSIIAVPTGIVTLEFSRIPFNRLQCPECGKKAPVPGVLFCPYCGHRL